MKTNTIGLVREHPLPTDRVLSLTDSVGGNSEARDATVGTIDE